MKQWIKLSGKLVYEPNRGEDFRKQFKAKTLVIELPRGEIDLYYQWFISKKHGLKIQRPMFGSHVTVVRGDEKPKFKEHWKKYDGQIINFDYSPNLEHIWQFWSLPVRGDKLMRIREELGLKNYHNFHLTIGREYEWQKGLVKHV